MKKIICLVRDAKKGEILKGTGPGSPIPAFSVNKISKVFKLRGDSWKPHHIMKGIFAGDNVVFVYS